MVEKREIQIQSIYNMGTHVDLVRRPGPRIRELWSSASELLTDSTLRYLCMYIYIEYDRGKPYANGTSSYSEKRFPAAPLRRQPCYDSRFSLGTRLSIPGFLGSSLYPHPPLSSVLLYFAFVSQKDDARTLNLPGPGTTTPSATFDVSGIQNFMLVVVSMYVGTYV